MYNLIIITLVAGHLLMAEGNFLHEELMENCKLARIFIY